MNDAPIFSSWGQLALFVLGIGFAIKFLWPLLRNGFNSKGVKANVYGFQDASTLAESIKNKIDQLGTQTNTNVDNTRRELRESIERCRDQILNELQRTDQ